MFCFFIVVSRDSPARAGSLLRHIVVVVVVALVVDAVLCCSQCFWCCCEVKLRVLFGRFLMPFRVGPFLIAFMVMVMVKSFSSSNAQMLYQFKLHTYVVPHPLYRHTPPTECSEGRSRHHKPSHLPHLNVFFVSVQSR